MSAYVLVTGDFVKTGGMDRANFALAEHLARQGRSVSLVAYRVDSELLAYPNVEFHAVPKLAGSYTLSEPLLDWAGRRQAQKIERIGGRTIVNGGNCRWGDVNWVHYVHAAYEPASSGSSLRSLKTRAARTYALAKERQALREARTVIVNSKRTERDLVEYLGISAANIRLVYLGVDRDIFFPATPMEQMQLRQRWGGLPERPVVAFIGALGDRRKGFDTLFAAWQILCSDPQWDADLVVIGAGAELAIWEKRLREAGLGDRVRLLGFRSDVPDLLRAADCLVSPTRYEAYGLGVHEALCCGLPAIVSASAGVAERYPAELTHLLLPRPDDIEDLVAKLARWRENRSGLRAAVQRLSVQLRGYTWDDMARNFVDIIEADRERQH